GPGGGLCPCSAPRVASCPPAPWHRRGIGVARGPRQPRRGPQPFAGTPALREAGLQAPARLPGAATCVAARFERPRRGGQREPSVLGPSGQPCCVLLCFPLLPVAVTTLQTGGRPGEALPRRSEGVRSRKQPWAPGVRCLTRSPALPRLFFSRLAPVTTWTVPGAGGGGRARAHLSPTCPTLAPLRTPPRRVLPLQAGARASCRPQGSCSPPPSPASAKAQTPAALRFGDGRDVSPCGLAPRGTGCRVQPCSPAPSSLRPVREHQGFWGAQCLQTRRWTGMLRGPDALATFRWAEASRLPSPAEQGDRAEAVRGGEARAPGIRPETPDRGGSWPSKACPGPFCESLNPWSPSFPCVPSTPGWSSGRGSRRGREALVSVHPSLLALSCSASPRVPSPRPRCG
uniref:Uncharacterized protein n=1 Tax=Mustela putorius furo TaxID=9669 RepID=M3Z8D5_MUSPF